jgi:excinuclease ABC subunit C
MVVFIDGHPRPREYRRFRIKTVEGANDFASMAEVLRRRFRRARERLLEDTGASAPDVDDARADGRGRDDRSFAALPDLVIVDGGKGQLSAAADVMREMGVKEIPTVGLAKQHEEIYVQDVSEPVVLARHSQALYLVQRLRDEAHRFAITYHRGVRARTGMQSALDTIPGVGPKRKKALLRKFGSVRGIREASVDEIAATVGFTKGLAEKVKAGL